MKKIKNVQIDKLIDAALSDGVITEKERQIIFNKAESLGLDLDEFEMMFDSRTENIKVENEESNSEYKEVPLIVSRYKRELNQILVKKDAKKWEKIPASSGIKGYYKTIKVDDKGATKEAKKEYLKSLSPTNKLEYIAVLTFLYEFLPKSINDNLNDMAYEANESFRNIFHEARNAHANDSEFQKKKSKTFKISVKDLPNNV